MSEHAAETRQPSSAVPWWALFLVAVAAALGVGYAIGPKFYHDLDYWKTFLWGRGVVLMFSLLILFAILHARAGLRAAR
jgi:hypothetical protein